MYLDRKEHQSNARHYIFKKTTKSIMVSSLPILFLLVSFNSLRDVFWVVSGTLIVIYHLLYPFTVKLNALHKDYDEFSIKEVLKEDIKNNSSLCRRL